MKLLPLLLILASACAGLGGGSPSEGKRTYAYVDASGAFVYTREVKLLKKKLITRTQISSTGSKVLEKSITVTQLGSVKGKKGRTSVSRPFAAEFTVWLEGKQYSSKLRLDPPTKSMFAELNSPEEKWKGRSSYPVPKGTLFCFFSQIPDCLYHNKLLEMSMDRKEEDVPFVVVWDSFPFIQEQFSGVGMKLFATAVVKYEGEQKAIRRFSVDVNGQSIVYHFTKSFDLVRMLWITQGVSILPPGEAASNGED